MLGYWMGNSIEIASLALWIVTDTSIMFIQIFNYLEMSMVKVIFDVQCLKFCFISSLTHWGRVTHICVSKITIMGSDNGLSPDRRQAIIWTNARLLSIKPLRTYLNENLIKKQQFSLKKNARENVVWKMASILSRLQCVNNEFLNFLESMFTHNHELYETEPCNHGMLHLYPMCTAVVVKQYVNIEFALSLLSQKYNFVQNMIANCNDT